MVAIQTTSKVKKAFTRIGAIGTVSALTVTGGLAVFGGTANAQTLDSGQQDGQQQSGGHGQGYDRNSGDSEWNKWEPTQYKQQTGADYGKWHQDMMQKMQDEAGKDGWGNGDHGWKPSGDQWQSDWGNWNPDMWKQHGSSYENWRDSMMEYMNKSSLNIQVEYATTTTTTTSTTYKANISANNDTRYLNSNSSANSGQRD